jgi:hypothetical protein
VGRWRQHEGLRDPRPGQQQLQGLVVGQSSAPSGSAATKVTARRIWRRRGDGTPHLLPSEHPFLHVPAVLEAGRGGDATIQLL